MLRGDAGALHDRPIETVARVETLLIDRAAVVLGSTQSFDVVNVERAMERGFDVVRRRSGGGVVILQPSDHVWIDVTVPRGHELWSDDVERATWWLGEVWCDALRAATQRDTWSVHREKLVATAPQRTVCFASVGPGEVVELDGRGNVHKVVGVSQRRTKDAARFQCTVFRAVDASLYGEFMRESPPESLSEAMGVGDALVDLAQRVRERLSAALS